MTVAAAPPTKKTATRLPATIDPVGRRRLSFRRGACLACSWLAVVASCRTCVDIGLGMITDHVGSGARPDMVAGSVGLVSMYDGDGAGGRVQAGQTAWTSCAPQDVQKIPGAVRTLVIGCPLRVTVGRTAKIAWPRSVCVRHGTPVRGYDKPTGRHTEPQPLDRVSCTSETRSSQLARRVLALRQRCAFVTARLGGARPEHRAGPRLETGVQAQRAGCWNL